MERSIKLKDGTKGLFTILEVSRWGRGYLEGNGYLSG